MSAVDPLHTHPTTQPNASSAPATRRPRVSGYAAALAALLIVTGATIVGGMLRSSATFDEIVAVAGGARGYQTGDWAVMPEHPPLTLYLYGLPVYLSGINYPPEIGPIGGPGVPMARRYEYARDLYWELGNDPERVALLARLPAVLCALALIALASLFTRSVAGPSAGLLAALLVAALPDVLAHGGVAYNDLPMALALFAAVWATDAAVRRPGWRSAVVAGALIGIAAGVKNSAVALAPIGVILLSWEALARPRDVAWRKAVGAAALVAVVVAYLTLVVVFRGDVLLVEYRSGLRWAFGHTHEMRVPAYLLGQRSEGGWWYYFPVAFIFKTSAGLHVLMVLALGTFAVAARRRQLSLVAPLRPMVVLASVFLALLLMSDLNIGFRHAMPVLPPLCVMTAVGVHRLWRTAGRALGAVVVASTSWMVIHVAGHYPHFLAYLSEYRPGVEGNYQVLADSSLDWGQGLLELRDFMHENGIASVYLSYFGSAPPSGYGIAYVPWESVLTLATLEEPVPTPRWAAISATNLAGQYLRRDPFARFREVRPDRVLARTIYLYRIED
ncbi:MAG: glycosyltransferase family 39 protein [Deltaproteobacteria bacterium]|nr:glycosyltransferase family 39 protein [Deltaproteobacteria bacterium]